MNEIKIYLDAAIRKNTRRSYQGAIEHFEVEWGGVLPATAEHIARYLASYANKLAFNSLKVRLSALSQWHILQGFPDPTRTPLVRQTLRGIRAVHPRREKQAEPLQLRDLEQLSNYLLQCAEEANSQQDLALQLRCLRDKALILIGFWRGFRSDELCRLRVENLTFQADGLSLYLPYSKSDRDYQGTTYQVPALHRLCPVQACREWLAVSGLQQGPLFCAINRWGHLSAEELHVNSIIPLLRQAFKRAGINAEQYSSHSLRRGFATWASANGWDIKSLMQYVGWRDMKSAMRYIDVSDAFGRLALNQSTTDKIK